MQYSCTVGDKTFLVDVAVTPEQKRLGLSRHSFLHADSGMLFLFENELTRIFHTMGMHFPIDIIWINSLNTVVGVTEALQENVAFISPKPCKYVLEVPYQSKVKENDIAFWTDVNQQPIQLQKSEIENLVLEKTVSTIILSIENWLSKSTDDEFS